MTRPLFIVRHGQTASNLTNRYAGSGTEPLTYAGRAQMADLAARLRDLRVDAIWSSEIRRADESAKILSQRLGVPLTRDNRLNEFRMGPWEGLTEMEIAHRFPADYRTWMEKPDALSLPGRESLVELRARIGEVIEQAVASLHRIVLVTHVALIRVALLRELDLSLGLYKRIPVGNAECFVLDAKGDVRRFDDGAVLGLEVTSPQAANASGGGVSWSPTPEGSEWIKR